MPRISRSSILVVPTLAAALLALCEGEAAAVTFTVDSAGDTLDFAPGNGVCATFFFGNCTLRAAVMEANALPGPDTIVIPSAIALISLANTGAGENGALSGDLDITDTLTIVADNVVIDGLGSDRIFHVLPGVVADISGVTLVDGWGGPVGGAIYNQGDLVLSSCKISGNAASDHGGGIKSIVPGSLVVQGCEIGDNVADRGGGIYSNTDLVIEDAFIERNDAGLFGGGLYVTAGTALTEIAGTRIADNTAGERGGGIFTTSPMNLAGTAVQRNVAGIYGGGLSMYTDGAIVDAFRSDFTANEALDGGGIHNFWGELTLRRVGVWNNVASGSGGGIDNQGLLLAHRGAIYANTATTGAGINVYGLNADLTLHNMTISGNAASGAGGGLRVHANAAGAVLNNVTIVENTGTAGGLSASGPTTMVNTIVGDNLDLGGAASDCVGSITSNGHNLVEDTAACVIGGPATADLYGVAPGLGPLTANGGRTPTHAVLAGSAALDAGDNATCRPVDQRGVSRPQGGTCDIGAYERS